MTDELDMNNEFLCEAEFEVINDKISTLEEKLDNNEVAKLHFAREHEIHMRSDCEDFDSYEASIMRELAITKKLMDFPVVAVEEMESLLESIDILRSDRLLLADEKIAALLDELEYLNGIRTYTLDELGLTDNDDGYNNI